MTLESEIKKYITWRIMFQILSGFCAVIFLLMWYNIAYMSYMGY